jgi:glycosyltransferase involved in cell wall biosynthesis
MERRLNNFRIGYVSHSSDFSSPTDRRRFVHYAKNRGINFEIAKPENEYDIVYVTHGTSDITLWSKYDKSKAIVIYEIIDSYLATPGLSFLGLFRGVMKYLSGQHKYCVFNYKKSVELMCKRADVVVCSSKEQKDSIRRYCDNVYIILDVKTMYCNYKKVEQSQPTSSVLNIAWEGLPHNIKSFAVIREALSILSKQYQINLHLITALKYKKYMNKYVTKHTINEVKKYIDINNVYLYQWNELTVSHIASACDFAVIPINSNDPMDNGKPEDKLLIFWLMGLPTVVSETPAHLRAMSDAGLSMSCGSTNDWVSAIRNIADNESNRNQTAKKGFDYASRVNSEEKIMSSWDNMFSSVIDMKINKSSL